jgi:hypothetical protein
MQPQREHPALWAYIDETVFSDYVWSVRLSSDVSEIKLVFSIPPHRPTPNFAPSWNLAPTDPCAYRLCHPNVVPMETAEPSDRCDTPDCLRRSMERSILVECKVRARPL